VGGFSCGYAQGFLAENGFEAEMIGPPDGAEAPTITSQYPAPGTSVPAGSTVRIYCA
jgi:beta-lactam-binding protein with PASTA domain